MAAAASASEWRRRSQSGSGRWFRVEVAAQFVESHAAVAVGSRVACEEGDRATRHVDPSTPGLVWRGFL
jgi:hypothetical protein